MLNIGYAVLFQRCIIQSERHHRPSIITTSRNAPQVQYCNAPCRVEKTFSATTIWLHDFMGTPAIPNLSRADRTSSLRPHQDMMGRRVAAGLPAGSGLLPDVVLATMTSNTDIPKHGAYSAFSLPPRAIAPASRTAAIIGANANDATIGYPARASRLAGDAHQVGYQMPNRNIVNFVPLRDHRVGLIVSDKFALAGDDVVDQFDEFTDGHGLAPLRFLQHPLGASRRSRSWLYPRRRRHHRLRAAPTENRGRSA